jgi:AAA+ superfamily predicted ATPase
MNIELKIINIESTSDELKIDFQFRNTKGAGSWIKIHPETHILLKNSNQRFKLIKAIGIPVSPDKFEFENNQEFYYFTLQFPPLPDGINEFDLIEDSEDINAFNFYNLSVMAPLKTIAYAKSEILKKIESLALQLKKKSKETLDFENEVERLSSKIRELSIFLSLEKNETIVFAYALYSVVINETFCLSEMKRTTNFNPFDYIEIKQIIRDLEFKGWLKSSGSVGMMNGRIRSEEKSYTISSSIIKSLYNNAKPKIQKREFDAYNITDMINRCLRSYSDWDLDTDEMLLTLKEYEDLYSQLQPFKLTNDLNLNQTEKLILFYVITKTYSNDPVSDIDRLISNIFKNTIDKIKARNIFTKKNGVLFDKKLIEFVNEEFISDKKIKLSDKAIIMVFGEDAIFLDKEEHSDSSLCKWIKHENIVVKQLFYNENEAESINLITNFLKKEKYNEIIKRLQENKMSAGLSILFHGYPGTGKTETVYQIARETKRDILMVNISEIKDKYVGESEKRLKSIFETYKKCLKTHEHAPILLFNESDALIGKRMNVEHSIDQMNNAMQNILLQELEDFKGVLMATTNLTQNLDTAFERRFLYKIRFTRPTDNSKKLIWKEKLNFLNDDEALKLATEFEFSGGQIENISRKIFLDSLLIGKKINFDTVIKYCHDELHLQQNFKGKIGFNL